MSQGSNDPDDETLGSADQGELENTLSGLAPTAQDPDEDEAYTPTLGEGRSWDTFEQNPLRSMYGLTDDNTNSSSNNNSNNGYIHPEKFVRQVATRYKYNPKRRTEQNLKLLTHLTTSPFAALTANFPTWTDYKYSQHTKSNTAYTEALYNSLNELEAHFQSYILGCVETLVQSNHLQNFRPQTAGITLMIANFLPVAPQRINLGSNYASIVGACIYLSITCRPDISHAVGRISRAMHNPTPENANQVIQLLGYLKGTQQHRLTYYRDNHPMKPQLTKYAEKDRDFIDLLYTNEQT